MREKKEVNVLLGEQVRLAREGAGLTQEGLAERVDVSAQYISDLERGVVGVSIPTLKRLSVVLGVSCDRLLFGGGAEPDVTQLARRMQRLPSRQFQLLRRMVDLFLEAMEP